MKVFFININILFLLILAPTIPGYLHLLNQISNPPMIACTDKGFSKKINVLKGRFHKAEDFFSGIFDSPIENKNNSGLPVLLQMASHLLVCIIPSELSIKPIYFSLYNLHLSPKRFIKPIYLHPASPPPEYL